MTTSAAPAQRHRARVRVTGTVQGVGFRPFVYRLARRLELRGWVLNDSRGVLAEVEGPEQAIARFLARVEAEAPPLARVEDVVAEPVALRGGAGFRILSSAASGEPAAAVAADAGTCEACLAELFDPGDRRFRYPFVNCTDCGPRFTIVAGVPYDRPLTTMAGFEMCAACRAEYEDPGDRRYHAQPNACPDCGPRARLLERGGEEAETAPGEDAVAAAARALRAGRIVAIKGLGGYHLACRADREAAVAALRARKHREAKPFALVVPGVEAAAALVELGDAEEALLRDPRRPIVLAPRRPITPVATAVAPRSRELGVMLPYAPLHHLLLADVGVPLVLTSGNVSDEPIAFRDDDALARLEPIADLFLVHDRPIATRTDDSVVRVVVSGRGRRPLLLRRSRGYVPEALALPVAAPRRLLACGAEQKSTFCLAKGGRAWVGHHVGDLENFETLRSFRAGVAHFERLFALAPELVAHDLHPDYLSTAYALEREGVETLAVQHHHAHLAACLAEHGLTAPAAGLIFDGSGYGEDGTIWGGELLAGDLAGYRRHGHLEPVPLPGGAAAIREPWRMACAWLRAACGPEPPLPPGLAGRVTAREWRNCGRLADTAVRTTSMGRLFDAVGALCGGPARVAYEGQAAVELEAIAEPGVRGRYEMPVLSDESVRIDPRPTLRAIVDELARGRAPGRVAARFHETVAQASVEASERVAAAAGVDRVVLAGGVFQNRLLLERTAALLAEHHLRPLLPERLPPNDGAISYGQAAIAAVSGG